MAIPHAQPGTPVDLRTAPDATSEAKTAALVKNDSFEAIRLVLPKDHEVCHHREIDGPITLQCLEGRIAVVTDDATHELSAGQWTHLAAKTPHSLRGVEDSVVLLTLIFR